MVTDMEGGMILILIMAMDTVATMAGDIPIMEVPTGQDTTTVIIMVTMLEDMVMGVIIPKPITVTEEWITGIMPDTPGLPEPQWVVPKQVLLQIPGTEAVPVKLLPVLPRTQLSEAATIALSSVPTAL